MNSLMSQFSDLLDQTHAVRDELWGVLNDGALRHSLGGNSLTLGGLCKEMGEIEYAYAQSFKTFKQDFAYRNPEAGLDASVDKLRAWFQAVDADLSAALKALPEEAVQARMIDRVGDARPHQLPLLPRGAADVHGQGQRLPQVAAHPAAGTARRLGGLIASSPRAGSQRPGIVTRLHDAE